MSAGIGHTETPGNGVMPRLLPLGSHVARGELLQPCRMHPQPWHSSQGSGTINTPTGHVSLLLPRGTAWFGLTRELRVSHPPWHHLLRPAAIPILPWLPGCPAFCGGSPLPPWSHLLVQGVRRSWHSGAQRLRLSPQRQKEPREKLPGAKWSRHRDGTALRVLVGAPSPMCWAHRAMAPGGRLLPSAHNSPIG